jgi:hypothetical protein
MGAGPIAQRYEKNVGRKRCSILKYSSVRVEKIQWSKVICLFFVMARESQIFKEGNLIRECENERKMIVDKYERIVSELS